MQSVKGTFPHISACLFPADRTPDHQIPQTSHSGQRQIQTHHDTVEEGLYTRHYTPSHSYNAQTATQNCSRYWVHERQIRHTCASCEASQGSSPFGQGSFIYPSYTGPGPPGMYRYLENPFYKRDHTSHSRCKQKGESHSGQRSCSADVWSRSHSSARHPRSFHRLIYPSGIHQSHFVNSFHNPFPSAFNTTKYRGHGNTICSPFIPANTHHCESDPEYSTGSLHEASNHATCGSCSSESLPSLDKICSQSLGDVFCDVNSNHSTYGSTDNRLHSEGSIESNMTDLAELREQVYRTFNKALKKHISSKNQHHYHHLSHSSSISSCDSNTFQEICNQQSTNQDIFVSGSYGRKKLVPSLVPASSTKFNDVGTSMTPDIGSKQSVVDSCRGGITVSGEIDDKPIDSLHSDSIFSSCQNCDQWATDSSSLSLSSFCSDIKPSLSSSSLSLSDIRSSCDSWTTDSSGLSLSDMSGLSVYPSEESLQSVTSHIIANINLPVRDSGAPYLGLVSQYTCKACDRNRSVIKSTRLAHRYAPYHIQKLSVHDSMYSKCSITSDCILNCRRRRNITSPCGYHYHTGANRKLHTFMDSSNIKELLLWIRNFKYRDKDKCCTYLDCSCEKDYSLGKCKSAEGMKLSNCHVNSESSSEWNDEFDNLENDAENFDIGSRFSTKIYGASSSAERTSLLVCNEQRDGKTISCGERKETDFVMTRGTTFSCDNRQKLVGQGSDTNRGCDSTRTIFCVVCRQQLSGQADPTHQACRSMVVFTEPQGEYGFIAE